MNTSLTAQNPHSAIGLYAMTKAALENMVKWLSVELRDDDIRVNGVAPGLIKTELSEPLWANRKKIPPKALGDPD